MVYALVTHHGAFHGKWYGISHGWPKGTCAMVHTVKRNCPWGYAIVFVQGDVDGPPYGRSHLLVWLPRSTCHEPLIGYSGRANGDTTSPLGTHMRNAKTS